MKKNILCMAAAMMIATVSWAQSDYKVITVKGVSFKMIKVAGGTFLMGCTPEQEDVTGSDGGAYPVHSVTLSDYYIGETEVTQWMWEAVMGSNPSKRKGHMLPMDNVSWNDCQEFIRRLNSKTGRRFRLPTEAEWEFAARGGTRSKHYKYAGSNDIEVVAWYGHNGGTLLPEKVKTKAPNELEIYDMSGNVDEWCQDIHKEYSREAQINPVVDDNYGSRVLRGGRANSSRLLCRVSARCNDHVNDQRHGFRLVLSE